jgi:hypothetical protein
MAASEAVSATFATLGYRSFQVSVGDVGVDVVASAGFAGVT